MTPSQTSPSPIIWVLTDEVVGHANQSLGVAEALGLPFEARALRYSPWAALPGALGPGSLIGLDAASRGRLAPPWPTLVIATGRRLGAVARWIKRRARADGMTTHIVQIMDPVQGRDGFDLIAAPAHDRMPLRANLFETIGAPHRITASRLAAAADRWRKKLAALPAPRIAVLVGGATRRRGFPPVLAEELGRLASRLANAGGGSLLISTSRRTGAAAAEALARAVSVPAYIHRWGEGSDGQGDNPYFAFLALADALIVTGESMSMCSEACATGKPVYIYAPPAIVKPAFTRLHDALYRAGMARPLNTEIAANLATAHYAPLAVAREIAEEIHRRIML